MPNRNGGNTAAKKRRNGTQCVHWRLTEKAAGAFYGEGLPRSCRGNARFVGLAGSVNGAGRS